MAQDFARASGHVTVVGIGASAGGILALSEFFAALPPNLGLAYVVVMHLAPHHQSELAAVLGRHTKMSVVQVDATHATLQPDCVYVIPPNSKLQIDGQKIAATPFDTPRAGRAPIDLFLRSLAKHGDGFAVIFSGGNSDGTIGAKAVKEAGGVVLVQDPLEAAHASMPQAVIDAGIADVVLPARQLAFCLAELWSQRQAIAPLIRPAAVEHKMSESDEAALKRILELVRARTGHDFSRYKRNTILRRLARRMQLKRRADFEQYIGVLKDDSAEVQALFEDLLISVTTFFRDPEAWEAFRTKVVIPLVERAKTAGDPIRAWVPACATGEEAYTIAMLFREELSRSDVHCDLVIFASDVDEQGLAVGREGLYPGSIGAELSEARLARFFRAENDHYRVISELRDLIVFASHNLLRDPPFSKLDVISCRNLLIYLDRELQREVQHIFRYALRDGGRLLIGVSETADVELFEPLDKQHRLFEARASTSGPVRLPQASVSPNIPEAMERARDQGARVRYGGAEIHAAALEALAPPSLIVDARGDAVHLSESVGRFLQPRGGPPTRSIIELVRPELADEVRSGLHRAFDAKAQFLSRFVPVQFNGNQRLVAVLMQPRTAEVDSEQTVLVMFLEGGEAHRNEPLPHSLDGRLVATLREKLSVAEHRLETMRLEHATAYEDLRAANEELQSLNEEYRSTTEELETSKEELQSVNEELQTVNQELKMKLEEVSYAKSDLENFMAATDLAILFLDRRLAIKRFTPPLAELFSVKPHDQGRPIGDLTHHLEYDDLAKDALRVLGDLAPIERQVRTRAGQALTVRIRPYRTAEDKIDGVVITFFNR